MKNPSAQTLVRKLDQVFSKFIRTVYSKNGAVRCITCGKWDNIESMHCGHFVNRDIKSTRWSEKNCHPQCPSCNTFHEGRKDEYALFLVRKYGANILEELNTAKYMIFKLDTLWLEEMCREYKEKLKELCKEP